MNIKALLFLLLTGCSSSVVVVQEEDKKESPVSLLCDIREFKKSNTDVLINAPVMDRVIRLMRFGDIKNAKLAKFNSVGKGDIIIDLPDKKIHLLKKDYDYVGSELSWANGFLIIESGRIRGYISDGDFYVFEVGSWDLESPSIVIEQFKNIEDKKKYIGRLKLHHTEPDSTGILLACEDITYELQIVPSIADFISRYNGRLVSVEGRLREFEGLSGKRRVITTRGIRPEGFE